MTHPRSRNWFGWLGLTVSALVLVIALAGLAAPFLASRWIEFDVFSHFRLHFIAIALVACVAMACARMWPLVMFLGLCVTPLVIAALPSIIGRSDAAIEAVDGEVPVKILTYNTWFRNDDWPALEAYLRKEDADIVVMMEFGPSKRPLLKKLRPLYPYQKDCVSIGYCHLVLMSKRPFESAGHRLKWSGPPIIWARFGRDLGRLTVIGTHLTRPPFAATQLRQLKALAREANKLGDPIIVAGDFNATKWSFMLERFQSFSGLGRLTGEPTWPTFFFGLPQLGIDHIFVSGGIRPLANPKRGEDVGSDHLPMSARLAIEAP